MSIFFQTLKSEFANAFFFFINFLINVFKMQYSVLTFTYHFILKCITVLKFSVTYLFHYAFYLVKAEKVFNPMVPYFVV